MNTGPMTTERGHDDRGPVPSYVVPNSWEHARQRFELLEACYDAASFKRARALGVRRGWRCLEAGAGHGSFARWLGAQVGATGSVLAVDLDTRLLAGITEPNIEVRQMDLVSGQLPRGEFDFVHTSLVLMHIPAREQVLGRLCAALRPGGTLLVEEHDGFPVLAAATGPTGRRGSRSSGRAGRRERIPTGRATFRYGSAGTAWPASTPNSTWPCFAGGQSRPGSGA